MLAHSSAATARTCVRRLFVLLVGYEVLPKSVSTKGSGAQFIMSEPICCYLLDTEQGWILLDTGFDPVYVQDPALAQKYLHSAGIYPPIVTPEHELPGQLKRLGLNVTDIRQVVLSHLHLDHAGYLKLFKHAPVHIQRLEYEHGFSSAKPISYFLEDYSAADISWQIHEGDWELMPGLEFLLTRGHTPGHQSAVVRLPRSGTYILPFDAGDLQENFDEEILPGESVDDEAALSSIRRLNALVREEGGRLILFHDPVAIQKLKLCPEYYD